MEGIWWKYNVKRIRVSTKYFSQALLFFFAILGLCPLYRNAFAADVKVQILVRWVRVLDVTRGVEATFL